MIRAILCLLAISLLTACGPITPNVDLPIKASLNKNGAHSGIYALRRDPDGSIAAQLWYPENRENFNAYAAKYGKLFLPALGPDDHLTRDYPQDGWLLESEYVKGRIVPITPGAGFWQADAIAIANYIQLLKDRRDDLTP